MEGDDAHGGPRLQVIYKESRAEWVGPKLLSNRRRRRAQEQQQLSIGVAAAIGGNGNGDEPPLVPRAVEEVLLLDSFRPAPRGSALAAELVGEGSRSGRCGRRVRVSLQHPVDHAHILALTQVLYYLMLYNRNSRVECLWDSNARIRYPFRAYFCMRICLRERLVYSVQTTQMLII